MGGICLKKFLVALTVSLLCVTNFTYAASDDLSLTVGAVAWYNRLVPMSRVQTIDIPRSSWAYMEGPEIKARYKNLYLGVTYLLSSNDYHMTNSMVTYGSNVTDVTSSASRSDIDVVVGYMLTPRIDVNAGYKGIFVEDTATLAAIRGTFDAKRNEAYNLGTLGAVINLPLGSKTTFFLNGNAMLGAFDYKINYPDGVDFGNDVDQHFLAWGLGADTKLAYNIIDNLSAAVGLKFQYIKAGTDNSNFFGPTAHLDYRF